MRALAVLLVAACGCASEASRPESPVRAEVARDVQRVEVEAADELVAELAAWRADRRAMLVGLLPEPEQAPPRSAAEVRSQEQLRKELEADPPGPVIGTPLGDDELAALERSWPRFVLRLDAVGFFGGLRVVLEDSGRVVMGRYEDPQDARCTSATVPKERVAALLRSIAESRVLSLIRGSDIGDQDEAPVQLAIFVQDRAGWRSRSTWAFSSDPQPELRAILDQLVALVDEHDPDRDLRGGQLEPLLGLLDSESWQVRRLAVRALGEQRDEQETVVRTLERAFLRDPEGEVRVAALDALIRLGAPATVALARIASDPAASERDRERAALGLARRGEDALRVVHVLRDALAAGPPAGRILGTIGPATLELLLRALRDGSPTARREAVRGLRMLGPEAREGVPDLAQLAIEAGPGDLADDAIDTLEAIGISGAAGLGYLLRNGPRDTAVQASFALSHLGASAWPARAALEWAVGHPPDSETRDRARYALGSLRPR